MSICVPSRFASYHQVRAKYVLPFGKPSNNPKGKADQERPPPFYWVETEALRGVVTGLGSHSQKVLEQGSLAPSLASFVFQIGFESVLRKSLNVQLISFPQGAGLLFYTRPLRVGQGGSQHPWRAGSIVIDCPVALLPCPGWVTARDKLADISAGEIASLQPPLLNKLPVIGGGENLIFFCRCAYLLSSPSHSCVPRGQNPTHLLKIKNKMGPLQSQNRYL